MLNRPYIGENIPTVTTTINDIQLFHLGISPRIKNAIKVIIGKPIEFSEVVLEKKANNARLASTKARLQ